MKKLLAVLSFLFFLMNIAAGQGKLMVKHGSKGLYIDHTVAPKEGLFAIGRIYNVHPRHIAAFNNIDFDKGLNIGQVLHIPLTDTNFSQKTRKGTPVYYQAAANETLQKISSANNKVPVQSLRDWNKLSKDAVAADTKLVIGFLIANESAVALQLKKEKTDEPVKDKATDKPLAEAKKQDTAKIKDRAVVTNKPVVDKPVVKNEEVMDKPLQKEESKKMEPAEIKEQVTMNMTGQGYFKSSFDQQVKVSPVSRTETVTSGIFRMVNAKTDTKFYLLADGITPGTVIRIINPDNNKTVYAKVLGEMNGIRQNAGLNIRISDKAASALGIAETEKFIVTINY